MSVPHSREVERYAALRECPSWCRLTHERVGEVHARCTGEVLWPKASVGVELVRHAGADWVTLSQFDDDKEPATVYLTVAEAHELRDALHKAIVILGG